MAIEVFCNCGNTLSVGAELAGRKVRCKACDEVLRIPDVPMAFSDDGESSDDLPSDNYDVVDAGTDSRSCGACGAPAGPRDTACLACGAELAGGGGPGALSAVPRPVLLGGVGLVLLLVLGGVGKAVWTATRPGAHTDEGLGHMASGDHAAAERAFREALKYDAQHPGARVGLAQIGAADGESRLIKRYVSEVLEEELVSDPLEAARMRLALAWVLLEEKRYVRAQSEAKAAAEEASEVEGESLAVTGLAARGAGDDAEALRALEGAQRARFEHPQALRELALLLAEAERYADGRQAAEAAAKASDDAPAWLLVARLRELDGDDDAAAAALERALNHTPDDAVALGRLATLQLRGGDRAAALASARKAAEAAPDEPAAQVALGRALLANDQAEEAQGPLSKAVKQGAGWEADFLLGKAYLLTEDQRQGVPALQRALRQRSDDAALHLEAGELLLEAGAAQKAVAILGEFVRAQPGNYEGNVLLAKALGRKAHGRQRNDGEIRNHLEAALRIDPSRREAPLELGLHLFERLEPEEAAEAFKRGLNGHPRDKELLYYYGWACIRARKWAEAITTYEELVKIDAGYKDAKAKLDEAHEGQFFDKKR
jgi:tetratricopeptide (TPR) repeat protein